MARKSIQTNYYLFDASEREVVIPGGIQREQLILITNVTDNKVIYNFSDPELTATEYHISTDIRNNTTTRVVLAYDTTSMSDSDKLQIIYDDFEETVKPAETYHDAVNKSKVSTPQSQIDTDFEYGTQSTKWESLAMINNNPFAYKSDTPVNVTAVTANAADSRVIIVTVNTGDPLPGAGVAIYVQDTTFEGANGVFIVDESGTGGALTLANNQFAYTAKYAYTAGGGSIRDSARTAIFTGIHYTGSDIGGTITLAAQADGAIQVTCSNVHSLEVGNEIAIAGSAGTNVNGSWTVARITNPRIFFYYPNGTPSGSVNTGTIKLYPRPQGDSIHRAFDGGVKFSTNTFSKNQQAIRQTKRYFRYQSGKGVAFSTGSILAPAIENLDKITASGTTVEVVSSGPHNLTTDTIIDVRNCNDNLYNGQYQVTEVINAYKFKYEVPVAPTETTAAGEYTITPINAYGINLEIGMMDQQNGIFFRYANGELNVVRRTSTFQISGKVSVQQGESLVSSYAGTNQEPTKFSKQLKPGDYVVIRGSSYRVDGIVSDTQMVVFPDYRGPDADNVSVTKTVETPWAQSEWNIDRCDGTGKTGYNLDFTKMQMFYMDYSWYGAGFIRWGFRALDGNVIYAHKIPNNNQNTEAYMRSGNLPSRYEVNTLPTSLEVNKDIATGSTIIYVDKSPRLFPPSGTLRVKKTTSSSPINATYEYVNYDGKIEYKQDVTRVFNNDIFVSTTASLTAGGTQPIVFNRPFSNIVAGKRYFVASKTSSSFQITDTEGNSTGISLTDETGSALSPLAVAESGAFVSLTREKAGDELDLTIADGTSTATVTSTANLQVGQRVIGPNIDANTYVSSITNSTVLVLSKAVAGDNPTGVKFITLSNGSAQSFTYQETQPTTVELIQATSVPSISHWGSSVIMDGEFDDDRAYIYSVGTKTGRGISSGETKGILALRVAPAIDNGIPGPYGTRELVNRMQLILRDCQIVANGVFFVELVLNPTVTISANWENVGGTSLAQYAVLNQNCELVNGDVIYAFYAGGGGGFNAGASTVPLNDVKEISNSILGGGGGTIVVASGANPTGIFPDGPEVLAVRVTNIAGGFGSSSRTADFKFSWTEAQA
jgi:hypothetical protein